MATPHSLDPWAEVIDQYRVLSNTFLREGLIQKPEDLLPAFQGWQHSPEWSVPKPISACTYAVLGLTDEQEAMAIVFDSSFDKELEWKILWRANSFNLITRTRTLLNAAIQQAERELDQYEKNVETITALAKQLRGRGAISSMEFHLNQSKMSDPHESTPELLASMAEAKAAGRFILCFPVEWPDSSKADDMIALRRSLYGLHLSWLVRWYGLEEERIRSMAKRRITQIKPRNIRALIKPAELDTAKAYLQEHFAPIVRVSRTTHASHPGALFGTIAYYDKADGPRWSEEQARDAIGIWYARMLVKCGVSADELLSIRKRPDGSLASWAEVVRRRIKDRETYLNQKSRRQLRD